MIRADTDGNKAGKSLGYAIAGHLRERGRDMRKIVKPVCHSGLEMNALDAHILN